MAAIEKEIGDLLRQKGLTLGMVESATGGLISHNITNVPGSSDYFKGAVISYANETKMKVVGVKEATLKRYGAVSPQVAEEMAGGGRKLMKVDICLADTGIAGPGGVTPGKAVGLFYLGMANKDGVFTRKLEFQGSREENKQKVAAAALEWLKEYLGSMSS
jgi:PncC family amidohydrolase